MEENNNKHLIIAGIGIIVIIALAIALPHLKRHVTAPTDSNSSPQATPANASAQTAATKKSSASAEWNATLQKYANSSITFAADCTASPITQAHRLGSKIALINNSDIAHTITVGTTSYAVGAYHYKTAYLTAVGTTIVNCDAHPNVANIGVQQ